MQHLVEAVRSKKLDRIAIGYGVGAWAAVQAASIAAPAFAWPQWAMPLAITAALIGLPAVLLGGWAVGVKRQAGRLLKPSQPDFQVFVLLALLLVATAAVLLSTIWPKLSASRPAASEPAMAPANSVAVLPFVNLSGDPAKEYFSDGISEELLNHLANTPELRVAARTSSFAFKGRRTDVRTIARSLHVRAILEGSVREAGTRVRVQAELVNGADGFQLWSHSYDRELTNVLTLQDEIARAVASSLAAKLVRQFSIRPRKIDPEAYRLYLLGKSYVMRGNKDDLRTAISLLKKVADRAPSFADGLAMLGDAEMLLAYNYSDAASLRDAEQVLRKALSIDPKNVSALKALVDLSTVTWRWNDVLKYFHMLVTVSPNSYDGLISRSGVADAFGYVEESSRADQAASQLNPLSLASKFNVAAGLQWQRKYAAAAAAVQEALVLSPTDPDTRSLECMIEVGRHHLAKARQLVALLPKEGGDQNRLGCTFQLTLAEGHRDRAKAMVDAAASDAQKNGGSNTDIADSYLKVGDYASAARWYERAYDARERAMLNAPRLAPPERRSFFQTREWLALWHRPPIEQWSAARVKAGEILRRLR